MKKVSSQTTATNRGKERILFFKCTCEFFIMFVLFLCMDILLVWLVFRCICLFACLFAC